MLEGGACSYKQETFFDFYIHVVDDKIVIHYKVDYFNLEIIDYSFPQSDIKFLFGYTILYSQLIRFLDFCNNTKLFPFSA